MSPLYIVNASNDLTEQYIMDHKILRIVHNTPLIDISSGQVE